MKKGLILALAAGMVLLVGCGKTRIAVENELGGEGDVSLLGLGDGHLSFTIDLKDVHVGGTDFGDVAHDEKTSFAEIDKEGALEITAEGGLVINVTLTNTTVTNFTFSATDLDGAALGTATVEKGEDNTITIESEHDMGPLDEPEIHVSHGDDHDDGDEH